MFPPSSLFLSAGLALLTGVASAAVPLDGLAANSPFMPAQSVNAAPVVAENAALEFRGFVSTREGLLFGIYDRTRNTGAWVRQGERGGEFNVVAYDAANEWVTVEYQGQKLTLSLPSARVGQAAPSAVPAPASNGAIPTVSSANPDEQRRLESVAAEVRRRRALRQSAVNNAPAPARPGGATP